MENQKSNKGVIIVLVLIIIILLALVILMATGVLSFKANSNDNYQSEQPIIVDDGQSKITEDSSNATVDTSVKSTVSNDQIITYYQDKVINIKENKSHLDNPEYRNVDIYDLEYQYAIIDIDNDDIPELIVYLTGSYHDTESEVIAGYVSIYTYDETKGDETDNYIVYIGSIEGRYDVHKSLYKMNDGRLLSIFGHMGFESAEYYRIENGMLVEIESIPERKVEDYTIIGDTIIEFNEIQ